MPYCQQFKAEIQKWEKELEGVKVLLAEYLESGEEEKERKIRERIKSVSDRYERFEKGFKEEFKLRVRGLLNEWCRKKTTQVPPDSSLSLLEFEFEGLGRVRVKNAGLYLNVTYFPGLIKETIGDISFNGNKQIESVDNLEKIGGDLMCQFSTITSFSKLRNVGGKLSFYDTPIKNLAELEEIGKELDIQKTGIKTIEDFRKVFPRLREIDVKKSAPGVSIYLSSDQENLKEELENLREKGELKYEGRILFR